MHCLKCELKLSTQNEPEELKKIKKVMVLKSIREDDHLKYMILKLIILLSFILINKPLNILFP